MTQTAPSSDRDATVALGERILAELGDPRTNNTLARWLAHHTARLMTEAEQAHASGAPDADVRDLAVRDAILQLWEARTHWPAGWPPKHAAEMARLLDELPAVDDPNAWVRPSLLSQLHTIHMHVVSTLIDMASPAPDTQTDTGNGTDAVEPSKNGASSGRAVPVEDGGIEAAWLDRFGEWLTEDEVVMLHRVAERPRRMDALSTWWMSQYSEDDVFADEEGDDRDVAKDVPASSPAEGPTHGTCGETTGAAVQPQEGVEGDRAAEETDEMAHPILDMLDAYRQVLVDLFEASAARRGQR